MGFRRLAFFPTCLALLGAGEAHAQFRLAPDWAERPDPEELSPHYPPLALQLGITGEAVLNCRVTMTGAVEACSVVKEEPAGMGFGPAALKMTRTFQMRPGLAPGSRRPEDEVRIPVRFRLPEAGRAALPPPPSAAKLALARRLAAAFGFTPSAERHLEQDLRKLERPLAGVKPETAAAAAAALREAFRRNQPHWQDALAALLANAMPEADLEAAVAFGETPGMSRYLQGDAAMTALNRRVQVEAHRRARIAARDAFCARLNCKMDDFAQVAPIWDPKDPDAPRPVLDWARSPTQEETWEAWPLGRTVGVAGFAALVCVIGVQGAPEECVVKLEGPHGLGVGDAALSLTSRYRLPAARLTPEAVGRKIIVLSDFRASPTAAQPFEPPKPSEPSAALAGRLVQLQTAARDPAAKPEWIADELKRLSRASPEIRAAAEAALLKAQAEGDAAMRELRTAVLATELDAATLRAAIRFEAGPGVSFRKALRETDEQARAVSKYMGAKIADEAQAAFCRDRDCGPAKDQLKADSSAPSTRTP